jgi:sugar lactone lactonase YvrE
MSNPYFRLLAVLFLLVPRAGFAQSEGDPFAAAQAAWDRRDYPVFLQHMGRLVDHVGKQPALLLDMARAHALSGDTTAALTVLRDLAAMQLPYRLRKDTAFASLHRSPTFGRVTAQMERNAQPALRSQAGFVVRDRALIPEGIAYDPATKSFFVGSLAQRKIIRVDARGMAKDFTQPGQDSLLAVLGLRVDVSRRLLWACSGSSQTGRSGLFAYDLKTGRLARKYLLADTTTKHLLNDLTILENGELYVTDSEGGTVYTLDAAQDRLVVYNPQIRFIYPNGITHLPGARLLYVAHFGGVAVIDLATKQTRPLAAPATVPLFGLDGLYCHENTLIGVQNGIEADRIVRYALGDGGRSVTAIRVLENNHPSFNIPTTGVLAGKSFYYIANSQLRSLQPDGSLKDPEKLKDVVVLQIPLQD